MAEGNEMHEYALTEQDVISPDPTRDDHVTPASEEHPKSDSLIGAPSGVFALIDAEWATAFWAIEDLAERARALDICVPLTCEDAEWVKIIRSVDDPAAGLLGAQLQDRIGSERAWDQGRQRWKLKMKKIRRSLTEEMKDFGNFSSLNSRLHKEGRLLLPKEEYHEQAIAEWIWDLDHSVGPAPTAEEFKRSKNSARESGEKWLVEIKAREHDLHLMDLDYRLDGEDFLFYRHLNLALADRGDSKITRAEFWAKRGRRFDPTRLSLYRVLLGDLALPAASLG